jgi:Fe-S cluster assembly protein SufD
MTQLAEKLHPWVAAGRPVGGPRWLQDLRDRAATTFTALGFPTVRDEEWRFTNVAPITAGAFHPAGAAIGFVPSDIDNLPYSGATGHRIVVVNGRYAPGLSRVGGLPRGVTVGSLSAAINGDLQADREIVQRYVGQLADFNARAFAALNTAFLDDGAYVHLAEGVILEEPVQVLFVSSSPVDHPVASYPRCLIVLGEHSQARVVETYVGAGDAGYLTTAVTEVFVGESAVLDHYKVQQESEQAFHVGTMNVHAARRANFSSHSFSLGGRLVRNDAVATLDGEGAEVTLNGLYLADGDRLVDNHTTIDHAQPHCPSHEIYKGILGGRAKAVFNGKIIVRQDAQKTDAKQTNRALLLSDDALINTKPQLEIFADDVKCTHGAAIGQLDEDALFYLRARGLTYFEARDMLIHAFAGEVIERVQLPTLKQELESQLYAQLARDLAEVDAA